MKKLLVQRLDTANYFRQIAIYCDGEKIGTLGFAQWKEFEIPADAREVYAKIDWCKSVPHQLELGRSEEVLLVECSSSLKIAFVDSAQYLKLHRIKRKDLPTESELRAFRYNFRRVAGLSALVLLIFTVFLLYTLYIAIYENSPIWYLLSALAVYNIYRINNGIKKRLKGQAG